MSRRPGRWTYRRDYVRPCALCRGAIRSAARNQRLHAECARTGQERRRRLRREVRRAQRGLFPGDHVPLERIRTRRRPPRASTAGWYRDRRCVDCGEPFRAGPRAQRCEGCLQRRLRAQNRARSRKFYWTRKGRAA